MQTLDAMKRVQDTSYFDVLSVRERQVTLLAAKGLANKAIAREVNITEGTIKLHLHKVYQKLGIKGRLALLVEASNLPPATEARILPPLSI
jgi:DNA-binding NarL/FixJ family response regulator